MDLTEKDKIRIAEKVGWISAIFSLIMAVLLIVNYIQVKVNDPINNKTIPALVKRLSQNPSDEGLKAEIRAFDLIARKAYFTTQWQLRTGSYLLLLGVLVTILSYRTLTSLNTKLSELDSIQHVTGLDEMMARKWVLYAGSGLVVTALLAGLLSGNLLNDYQVSETTERQETEPEPKTIATAAVQNKTSADTSVSTTLAPAVAKSQSTDTTALTNAKAELQQPQPSAIPLYPTTAELKANYPFFRGAEGIGIAYQKNTPTDWDGASGKNVLWKVKIPKPGFSSPIIWGNQVFITGADAQARMVYCYDKNSGKMLWEASADKIDGSPAGMPKVTSDTGLAAPTMATNGRAVFAIFATGDILALDLSGKRLWARNLGMPDNHYGHSSSLVVYKDKVLIQYDTNKAGKLIALSVSTGETVWETMRKSKIAWSSPALVNTGARMELILSSNPNVNSYDPESGKELWSIDCLSGEVGPSVGYEDGMVFAANEYAKLVGIKPGGAPSVVWQADEFLPEVASPLAIKGLLYVATSYGVLACIDAKTGEKLWSQEYGNSFYASPVYADGKVYVTDMEGKTYIVKTTRDYQLISTPQLGEKSVCAPAFANGRVYLRGMNQLYCLGTK